MGAHREKLSGIFVAVVTPFKNDEPVLEDLRYNLRRLNETALTGYLALGSNAEFRSLTDREQRQVLEVFAEEKGNKVVMVGTGCQSTKETVEKSKMAADMGFDYASALTPSYFPKQMDGKALQGFYEKVADSIPIPVLLYNAPGFTGGVQVPASTAAALSRHSNIAGMKDSSPTGPAKFLSAVDPDEDFCILPGSASFIYPMLHLGATGGIASLGNVIPEPCCRLYRLFTEGKYDEARELHVKLSRLNEAVSGTYGVPGVKAAMEIMGFRGGEPRHPLRALTDEDRAALREKFRAEGFLNG